MAAEQTRRIKVRRSFEQSAERIYDALLDPQQARNFLFTAPGGVITRAEIDARVGGRFNFTDKRGSEEIAHVGEYLELERPRRIVFTFAVPQFSAEYTTVTIDISRSGPGCELCLTHDGVLPAWADQTEEGWTMILNNCAEYLGGQGHEQ